jgi:hypothetical protein
MTSKYDGIFTGLSVGFMVGVTVCSMLVRFGGLKDALPNMRIEAVDLGHAEWVVSSDGSTEFKWKECSK